MTKLEGHDIVTGTMVKHSKGAIYEILGQCTHSETLEHLVLYRPISYEGNDWVRPFDMFMDGRFTKHG